jgi:2-keto-3-deoxy-L-rhamnonate aldolase RhmA
MNEFTATVRSGGRTFGTFTSLGSWVAAELCGAAGFDWVLVDLEHGAGDEQSLVPALQAISSTPAAGLVRVEANDRVRVTKALDAGAVGIMIPRIETALDARAAVQHSRYPLGGDRGVAMMNRGAKFGARTTEQMSDLAPLVILQIETERALSELRGIAEVDGVDVLFVGPSDLSWSLGIPGQLDNPKYRQAIESVARAAEDAGKCAGVLAGSADGAAMYLDLGYRFVGVSGDVGLLASAARSTVGRLAELSKRMEH